MTDRSKAATHAEGCCSWGLAHYECAVREIERLRKMHQDAYQRGLQAGSRGLREMYDAVQVVKRQDAWDNTRLTEALMAAEERAERAEAENKRLREERDALQAEVEALRADVAEWKRVAAAQAELHGEAEDRAERLAGALEDIRSRSSINLAMQSDPFELTARLGDIYQIADAAIDAALAGKGATK